MATNIPPHNLREIVDACVLMIEKPESTLKEIMKLVPPRFPYRRYIGRARRHPAGLQDRARSFIMRAKAAIEQTGKDRENIVVTEIPFPGEQSKADRAHRGVGPDEKGWKASPTCAMNPIAKACASSVEVKRGEERPAHPQQSLQVHADAGILRMILLSIVAGQPRELPLMDMLGLHRAPH